MQDLRRIANESLGNSKTASGKMDDVLRKQDDLQQVATLFDNRISELETLADITAANASAARNLAEDTLDTANDLLNKARTPLDEVNVNETKSKVSFPHAAFGFTTFHLAYTVCIKKRLVFEIQIRHILLNSSDKNCTCLMNSIEYG